jgi:hypothetical protein
VVVLVVDVVDVVDVVVLLVLVVLVVVELDVVGADVVKLGCGLPGCQWPMP